MSRRSRRKFTDEFKTETVKLIRDSGRSVGSVAKELDLTETAVRDSVKKAQSSPNPPPPRLLALGLVGMAAGRRRRVEVGCSDSTAED
jgi:MYXO-CTERM domain-containing protein